MTHAMLQTDEIPPVPRALAELEQAQLARADLPAARSEVAQRAADTLLVWNLPTPVALAALLAPLLEQGLATAEALAARYEGAAIALAERLLAWRAANPEAAPVGDRPAAHYALQLRRLFREAYLDLPGLHLPLLLLADHGARLGHAAVASAALGAQSDAVFIPLAEMLGVWGLRRTWIDQSMALQYPEDYTHTEADWLAASSQDKAAALADLEARLRERALAAGLPGPIQVVPNQPTTGSLLRRQRQRGRTDDLPDQMVIRVLCESVPDCYRMLGVVHGLGKPIMPRYAQRFTDYIAAPQSTGYRALHTAIVYKGVPGLGTVPGEAAGKIQAEFRILTPDLDTLNELGVIAAFHQHPERYGDAPAWWNRLADVTARLQRRYHYGEATTVHQFLAQHEIGSHSMPLYVFTPRGEVILLDEGSTPLDFAYRIHDDLSHHAARIEVNGQDVHYGYPLRNGDLVHVHYDPLGAGPDLSWLGYAATSQARATIRHALASRARAIHAGRGMIEDLLIKTTQSYFKDKQYRLTVTNKRLDAFLLQVAHGRGLPDLHALYEDVAAGRLAADQIVRRLISAELAAAVVNPSGARLAYPQARIRLCDKCRPVPGEPLIAFERRMGSVVKGLVVHRQGNARCPRLASPGKQIAVRWAEEADPRSQELIMFEIGGEDRYRLLEDVLAAVYEEPSARLHRVEAQAYGDTSADITLTVETDSLLRMSEIQNRIEGVRNVHQVQSLPASAAQRLALQAPVARYQPNPYATQEVYDRWMFYDREDPIREIRTWMAGPLPAQPLILHGQRRVGKSSLARYLLHAVIPQQGRALPVYVDLQGLAGFGPRDIAHYLGREVYNALQREVPAPLAAEEPLPWLDRALREAVAALGGARLLVMIDEFNVLIDQEHNGRLDPMVFANLRAVLNARRDVHWMLIVQDTHYRDPARWGSAGPLFQQTYTVALPLLDTHWANKLILEPVARCGIGYQSADIPERIYELTAGSPYLIQVLCYHLVDRVRRQQHSSITADDLRRVVDLVSNDGHRYFAHFTESLSGLRRIALAAVAEYGQGEWLGLGALNVQLQRRMKPFDAAALRQALEGLERQGMLELRTHTGSPQMRIPMRLFQEWVHRAVDLDSAIEAGHPGAA